MVFLEAGVRNFCDCVASNVHCFGMKGYIYPDQRECWWSADGCANCMYMKQKWRDSSSSYSLRQTCRWTRSLVWRVVPVTSG